MRFHHLFIGSLSFLVIQGCGGAAFPPPELVHAREAFASAQRGPAAELNPAQLHEAKTSLERAESSFRDSPSEPETVDLAVVSQLKTANVEAQAAHLQANRDKERAAADLLVAQKNQVANARSDTRTAQAQAASANTQAANATTEATMTREQLVAERLKRTEIEKRLRDALATLDKIASVKDSDRGLVITFQGDVLFKTAEWGIKPEGMAKLSQIADQLREQERRIIVEGHTDNQGGAGMYNQTLSEKRANAVRDYLVSKGIPNDLIRAVGYGPTKGIADNNSPEGRAANRRVEIIVEARK